MRGNCQDSEAHLLQDIKIHSACKIARVVTRVISICYRNTLASEREQIHFLSECHLDERSCPVVLKHFADDPEHHMKKLKSQQWYSL